MNAVLWVLKWQLFIIAGFIMALLAFGPPDAIVAVYILVPILILALVIYLTIDTMVRRWNDE